jgi:hypothetical protein
MEREFGGSGRLQNPTPSPRIGRRRRRRRWVEGESVATRAGQHRGGTGLIGIRGSSRLRLCIR